MGFKERIPTGAQAQLLSAKGGGRRAGAGSKKIKTEPQLENKVAQNEDDDAANWEHEPLKNDTQTIREPTANDTQTVSKRSDIDTQTIREPTANDTLKSPPVKERYAKGPTNDTRTIRKRSDIDTQTIRKKVSDQHNYHSLVGAQKALVDFYYESIQANGGESTFEIRAKDLETLLGYALRTIIDANYRLTLKGIIYQTAYKDGRGGWTQFGLEKGVKEQIHKLGTVSKRYANDTQTVSKRYAKGTEEGTDELPSSSSSLITELKTENPKTTTTPLEQIETDWVTMIEIPAFASAHIEVQHLRSIARYFARLGKDHELKKVFQECLDNFDLCLQIGNNYKNGPTSAFIGTMRNDGFFSPPNGMRYNPLARQKLIEQSDREKIEAIRNELRLEMTEHETPEPASSGSLDDIPF